MKAYHSLVVGDSGEGKTTLMREVHAGFNGYSVWIDHDGVGGIDGRAMDGAVTVSSLAELRRAQGTRIRYQCSDPEKAVGAIREHCKGVYDRTGYPVQVIVDEAQNAMPDGEDAASGNQLAKMIHEDRDDGVKVVIGSQDPQDLEYGPIKQCKYIVWVGKPHPMHRGFARYYDLLDAGLPTEQYNYVVFEKGPSFNWIESYRGETDPSFG